MYVWYSILTQVEAIQDAPDEMKKFKKQIPRVAQLMIPIWKAVCISHEPSVSVLTWNSCHSQALEFIIAIK